jgi:hypothetical protein
MKRSAEYRVLAVILVVACIIGFRGYLNAQNQNSPVPSLMNYQGRLTKPDGTPVPDGNYRLTFRMTDQPIGGNIRWSETHDPVAVRNGVFAVQLGSFNALSPAVFAGETYLEIQIGSDPPLAPRQRLASAAYALWSHKAWEAERAQFAETAQTVVNMPPGVPVGTVVAWWGNSANPPEGWVVCSGQTISDPQSPLNGMAVPDLRDKFVRGTVGNVRPTAPTGGVDTVNLAHSHTVHSHSHSMAHTHTVNNHTHDMGNHTHSGQTGVGQPRIDYYRWAFDGILEIHDDHTHPFTTGGPSTNTTGGASPGTSGPSTGETGASAPGTTAALGNMSIVPSYVGLVYIMRVK